MSKKKKSPPLYTSTLKIIELADGKMRVECDTTPSVPVRQRGVSPSVDMLMWLQALIVARLNGKPRAK